MLRRLLARSGPDTFLAVPLAIGGPALTLAVHFYPLAIVPMATAGLGAAWWAVNARPGDRRGAVS